MNEGKFVLSPKGDQMTLESTLNHNYMNVTSEQSTDDNPNSIQSKQMLPFSNSNVLRLQ